MFLASQKSDQMSVRSRFVNPIAAAATAIAVVHMKQTCATTIVGLFMKNELETRENTYYDGSELIVHTSMS